MTVLQVNLGLVNVQLNITQLLGINLQQIFEGDVFRDICQPLLMNHYKLVGFILLCYLQARYMGM